MLYLSWQLKGAHAVEHINQTVCYYDTMFRFREVGTNTENTVSVLVACSSFPADKGFFSARWRCFLEVMRVVNTAYCVKVFLTLIYILRERIEVFLLYEVLPSLLWWGMGCLVWKPELWGKMSSVITFKERGFYLKRARDKRGECVCTLSWHCQRLLWWNRHLMDGQRWSRLDQQTVWGAGRRQTPSEGLVLKQHVSNHS